MRNLKITAALAIAVLAFMGFQRAPEPPNDNDLFTIYLVRHSEKDVEKNPSNPPLTACGKERSELLSQFLDDVDLEVVYSTPYARTIGTAQPTADAKGFEIQEYDPSNLAGFANDLMKKQQDALVVGHSNTTGVLAGILVGEEIGSFDESIYNRIYQVVVHKDQARLHVFHTAFSCEE